MLDEGAERTGHLLAVGRLVVEDGQRRIVLGLLDLGRVERLQGVLEHLALGLGDDELTFVCAVLAVGHPEVGVLASLGFALPEGLVLVRIDIVGREGLGDAVSTAAQVLEAELLGVVQQLGLATLALRLSRITRQVLDLVGDQLGLRQRHLAAGQCLLRRGQVLDLLGLLEQTSRRTRITAEPVGDHRAGRGRADRRRSLRAVGRCGCCHLVRLDPRLQPAQRLTRGNLLAWTHAVVRVELNRVQRTRDIREGGRRLFEHVFYSISSSAIAQDFHATFFLQSQR
ncbi:hypothetical protein AERO9AM_11055 [Aeromicrobium sp. 9AM]|nr:hypothetical protein AERO9AM_11055 [Aeromicrobium sp. 9AM]